jgi:hypothetical protein
MKHLKHLLPLAACGFAAAAWSASEAGSSASSATSAASQSVGAISTSLTTSSNSSSKNTKVAAGDYTVIEIATADAATPAGEATPDGVARARLTLRAVGSTAVEGSDVMLLLPQQTVDQAGLSAGDTVSVRHRAYGLEFAAGHQRQAFFLVLDDAWYRELASTAVVL